MAFRYLVTLSVFLLTNAISWASESDTDLTGNYGNAVHSCIDKTKSRQDQKPSVQLHDLVVSITSKQGSTDRSDKKYYDIEFTEGTDKNKGWLAVDTAPIAGGNPFKAAVFASTTDAAFRQMMIGRPEVGILVIVEQMTPDRFDMFSRGQCPLGETSVLILEKTLQE